MLVERMDFGPRAVNATCNFTKLYGGRQVCSLGSQPFIESIVSDPRASLTAQALRSCRGFIATGRRLNCTNKYGEEAIRNEDY